MIASVLLLILFVFLIIDVLQGMRRGLFPSLIRFAGVLAVAILAFVCAEYVGNHVMEMTLTYEGEVVTVREAFEAILHSDEAVVAALDYSDTVKQLVMHMPEVLVKEILFVPLFFIFRLVSLPITGIINMIFFPSRKRCLKSGKVRKRKKMRWAGMLLGAVQGILCFIIVMVPVFGLVQFGEKFIDEFAESETEELAALCASMDESFVAPIDNAAWIKALDACGVRSLCLSTFHGLSHTTLTHDGVDKDIYYFMTLEDAFPTISAFLLLQDMDPEHMVAEDYRKLNNVFSTAKDSEEISTVLKEVTVSLVESYIKDEFRDSADVLTQAFVGELLSESTQTEKVDLEKELGAVKTILEIMDSASNRDVTTAFDGRQVDAIVETVVTSDIAYNTLVKTLENEEARETLRRDIQIGDIHKEDAEKALNDYRQEVSEAVTQEEFSRVVAVTDSIADLMGITLKDLSSLPEIPS